MITLRNVRFTNNLQVYNSFTHILTDNINCQAVCMYMFKRIKYKWFNRILQIILFS